MHKLLVQSLYEIKSDISHDLASVNDSTRSETSLIAILRSMSRSSSTLLNEEALIDTILDTFWIHGTIYVFKYSVWWVQLFDGSAQMDQLAKKDKGAAIKERTQKPQPLHAHEHRDEGFALDWSRVSAGRLASGDNRGNFYVWDPNSSGTAWSVQQYKVRRTFQITHH